MTHSKQGSSSFLKKRTKKLLRAHPRFVPPLELPSGVEVGSKSFLVLFFKKELLPFLALCGLLLPSPVFAHAFLDGAVPRVGSEIPAAPSQVVLHFTQGVEPGFSKIQVQDSAGASVTDGAPHSAGDPTHFAVGLKKIGPGLYTVIWHVTSVDTHKTQGKFHFTVTN